MKLPLSSQEKISNAIFLIRGHRVMLDRDLAALYQVETRTLVQAVKRNRKRFPIDFAFQLRADEFQSLRSQIVILNQQGRGRHSKYLPHVFTEQGVAMLSSVLKSARAIEVNVSIMRTFVRLRRMLSANKTLARKLSELEARIENHGHDIQVIFQAIRSLMEPKAKKPKRQIGFHP